MLFKSFNPKVCSSHDFFFEMSILIYMQKYYVLNPIRELSYLLGFPLQINNIKIPAASTSQLWVPVLAAALDIGGAEGRAVLVQQREQPGPLAGPGKQSQGEFLIITARTDLHSWLIIPITHDTKSY